MDEFQRFITEPPKARVIIQGLRSLSNHTDSIVFTFTLDIDSIVREEPDSSSFLSTLRHQAERYQNAHPCVKRFQVEKRVSVPYSLVKSIAQARIQELLPHFFDRSDCRLQVNIGDSVQLLDWSDGQSSCCGWCRLNCVDPCVRDPTNRIIAKALGMFGFCLLCRHCISSQDFTLENNNVVYFNAPQDADYWTRRIRDVLTADRFDYINI